MCRAKSLTIGESQIVGKRALVLIAEDKVVVTGVLRVLAGTQYRYADPAGTPGGGLGGSFGTLAAGKSGAIYGTATLEPLVGGMSGQDVCHRDGCGKQALGGRGGVALPISAGGSIVVASSGRIGAGGAGLPGSPNSEGALGGEGENDHGCQLSGKTVGGDGGVGAAADTVSTLGVVGECLGCLIDSCVRGGGGGGGLGRIRLRHAGASTGTGVISPAPLTDALIF